MTAPLIRSLGRRNLRFFMTAQQPCPYLAGQEERKVFTSLEVLDANAIHDALAQSGFRRSQTIAYRPACVGCDACVSARVVVDDFSFTKRWRRSLTRNADLTRALKPAVATQEQFTLLRRYVQGRHPHGGMAEMTASDFAAMVEETTVRTHIVEYRYTGGLNAGALAAAALVDVLGDGLSLVYSFFDPEAVQRGLGVYVVLDHIAQARAVGLPHVYLGYWIAGSKAMAYKAQFQPLQILQGGEWRNFYQAAPPREVDAAETP